MSVPPTFAYRSDDDSKDEEEQDKTPTNPEGCENPNPLPGDNTAEFKHDKYNCEQSREANTSSCTRISFCHILYVFNDYIANILKKLFI